MPLAGRCMATELGKTVVWKVGDLGDYNGRLPVLSAVEANLLARNAGLRLLCTLNHFLGDLDRVSTMSPACFPKSLERSV
eukprot:SAG11_NODE_3388_length_2479_cov_2.572269_2_plen_80_part_00